MRMSGVFQDAVRGARRDCAARDAMGNRGTEGRTAALQARWSANRRRRGCRYGARLPSQSILLSRGCEESRRSSMKFPTFSSPISEPAKAKIVELLQNFPIIFKEMKVVATRRGPP